MRKGSTRVGEGTEVYGNFTNVEVLQVQVGFEETRGWSKLVDGGTIEVNLRSSW